MIAIFIPVIEEADALIFRDRIQEPADLGIAVDRHLFREERVRESKVRIVLTCVFLFDDQIRNEVKDESGIVSKPFPEHRNQLIFIQYFPDDHTGADLETAAPVSEGKFFGYLCIWEIHLELFIREHHGRIVCRYFPDNGP